MNRQPHSAAREIIVADAIRDLANELRMIDVADYVAFIRLESMASIADIVESAAELYFMPGTLRLGHGCEAHVGWSDEPRIVLDLELKPRGVSVYFTLALCNEHATVEVNYVSFDAASPDPQANSAFLARALAGARIRKTADSCADG